MHATLYLDGRVIAQDMPVPQDVAARIDQMGRSEARVVVFATDKILMGDATVSEDLGKVPNDPPSDNE